MRGREWEVYPLLFSIAPLAEGAPQCFEALGKLTQAPNPLSMVSAHHYVPPGSELPLIICPVLSSLPEVAFVLQERLDGLVHAEGRADAKTLI